VVWRGTQSPIGKYVPDAVGWAGSGTGWRTRRRGGVADVQGRGGRGNGRLGGSARGWVCRARADWQPLSQWAALRGSGHVADTGGAVCATVVGIARNQGGSAWSP